MAYITNKTDMTQHLYSFDNDSVTVPPKFSGNVDDKFTNWVELDSRVFIVRIDKIEPQIVETKTNIAELKNKE